MFSRYPQSVVDRLFAATDVRAGDVLVDVECEVAAAAAKRGVMALVVEERRVASRASRPVLRAATVTYAAGSGDLARVIESEVGGDVRPRAVAFGSALLFHDRDRVLEACDACGADAVAIVLVRDDPMAWRAVVAAALGQDGAAVRRSVSREAPEAALARSAFRAVTTWRTSVTTRRTPAELAALATRQALRAGIVDDGDALQRKIRRPLEQRFGSAAALVGRANFTLLAARRAVEHRATAHSAHEV